MTEPLVAARLMIEIVHPDSDGRLPRDAAHIVPQWLNADGCRLAITLPSGHVVYSGTLEFATTRAQVDVGELLRFYYTPTQFPEET